MTHTLQEHPLWRGLDRSSRRMLEAMAQTVACSDVPALVGMAQEAVVLGWWPMGKPWCLMRRNRLPVRLHEAGWFLVLLCVFWCRIKMPADTTWSAHSQVLA